MKNFLFIVIRKIPPLRGRCSNTHVALDMINVALKNTKSHPVEWGLDG
jgi:hypothetical protein